MNPKALLLTASLLNPDSPWVERLRLSPKAALLAAGALIAFLVMALLLRKILRGLLWVVNIAFLVVMLVCGYLAFRTDNMLVVGLCVGGIVIFVIITAVLRGTH